MKEIRISLDDFVKRLEQDPRVNDDYVDKIELPMAFSTGNKFLRNMILEKVEVSFSGNSPSEWFEFSQFLEEVNVSQDSISLKYDSEKGSHPPLMSRKGL